MTHEGVEELNAMYVELNGRPADPMVGPAYAAVQILADAIERAGMLDRTAIRDAIAETDMNTVIGPVTFREDGTGDIQIPILQYQAGQPELVWPLSFAKADFVFPAPAWSER